MNTVEHEDDQDADIDLKTFRVVFEAMTCDVCGETTPVTRTCSCGAWEPRDDANVERRRAVVADVQAMIDAPSSPSSEIEFSETIDELSPWIGDLFDGLRPLGEKEADPSLVEAQVRRLLNVRNRVSAVPRRRPWLAIWDPISEVIDALIVMTRSYLDAAMAPDPEGAESFAAAAQGHLDRAAVKIHIVNERLHWWGLETSIRLPGSLVAAAEAAYQATGATNLIDLDGRGMERYERITGKSVGPTGVGVGLLLDLGLVDRAFDEERVFRVARAVYTRIDAHRPGFFRLVDDPDWRADLLNARRVFYEAQLAAETLARELSGERRLEVGAALLLGAKLTERVSTAIVGLVVASDPSLKVMRTADYAKIHATARRLGLGDLLLGFDARIRNAEAHTDFDVGQDHVVLGRNNRTKPEVVADDELVDIVLSAVESCAAIFAGIDCVLAEAGHPAAMDRFHDLPVEDQLTIFLAASGIQATRVDIRRDRLELSGSSPAQISLNPLTVVASLAQVIPEEVRRVTLRVKTGRGTIVVEAPLGPLRRAQSTTGVSKDAAYLEFLGRATRNGRPVMARPWVRFVAAHHFQPLIALPVSDCADGIEALIAAARHLKDRELADALSAALIIKRANEDGTPVSDQVRTDLARLAEFASKSPGPWSDGSGGGGGLVAA